jgi:uracil-DNA glycosylase
MAASTHALSKVHPHWLELFSEDFGKATELLDSLDGFTPTYSDVFNVFVTPPEKVKVVIVGQDPYPTAGDAMGLAFSVNRSEKLPKSLANIYTELLDDLEIRRNSGDLRDWQAQGVFLINRVLTTPIGNPLGHKGIGWEEFTEKIIAHLGKSGAVGLLMGKPAQEMAKYFSKSVLTPHPSPLSAYRGFFGAKPFSAVNALLEVPIKW